MFLVLAGAAPAADWGTIKHHRITGTQGSWTLRLADGTLAPAAYIDIGPDCSSLTIETGTDGHGGFGNCNLYVGYGMMPTSRSLAPLRAGMRSAKWPGDRVMKRSSLWPAASSTSAT